MFATSINEVRFIGKHNFANEPEDEVSLENNQVSLNQIRTSLLPAQNTLLIWYCLEKWSSIICKENKYMLNHVTPHASHVKPHVTSHIKIYMLYSYTRYFEKEI